MDASITVYADGDVFKRLNEVKDQLAVLLIVSEAHLVEGRDSAPAEAVATEEGHLSVVVKPSEFEKCERCWIHRETVGQNAEHPTLCHRCVEVLTK